MSEPTKPLDMKWKQRAAAAEAKVKQYREVLQRIYRVALSHENIHLSRARIRVIASEVLIPAGDESVDEAIMAQHDRVLREADEALAVLLEFHGLPPVELSGCATAQQVAKAEPAPVCKACDGTGVEYSSSGVHCALTCLECEGTGTQKPSPKPADTKDWNSTGHGSEGEKQ